ncbi:MAG: hypothetical protein ACKVXR_10870 [Planctomycetota bacterium]
MAAYDLDGRPLGRSFVLRGEEGRGTEIRAIAVDEDRRIWAADAASGCVRIYNVSGSPVGLVQSVGDPAADRAGALGDPAGIAVQGVEAETRILVSRRGNRRHALMVLDPGLAAQGDAAPPRSLVPGGDTRDTYRNLAGVALEGDRIYACEAGTGTVQVFRGGEFLFRMVLPRVGGSPDGRTRLEPRLVSPLPDGRVVVACGGDSGGALLLLDENGSLVAGLAEGGTEEGTVDFPTGLAVEEGAPRPGTRVAVLDRDGDRIQIFTLDGRCYGSFPETPEIGPSNPQGARIQGPGVARAELDPPPDSD